MTAHAPAVPGDMAALRPEDLDGAPAYVRARARHAGQRTIRRLTTSEGVEVSVPVAPVGARLVAWLLDLLLMAVIMMVLGTVSAVIAVAGLPGVALSFTTAVFFVLRTFYFVYFETRHQGRTPGKRLMKLRVVDRHGRPLRVESIFVRNVTRELEVLLPIAVLIAPEALFPGSQGIGVPLSVAWLLIFLFFPLFNRERLRVGDLLAGTMVVPTSTRVALYEDPAIGALMRVRNGRPVYAFSQAQLDTYGIFELQVLEELLVQNPRRPTDPKVLDEVADLVRRKIGWRDDDKKLQSWQFLHDFYAAMRARHERRLMLGQRQVFKVAGETDGGDAPGLVVERPSGVLESADLAPPSAGGRP